MTDADNAIRLDALAAADVGEAFTIAGLDVRGRVVRLGPVLDTILAAHAYPPAQAALLVEALTLTALLGALLIDVGDAQAGGQVTLQARGVGPVSLLVCDYRASATGAPAEVRGYLSAESEGVDALGLTPDLEALFGEGYLAMTLDPVQGQRYQGIVPLTGSGLAAAVQHYFAVSEQLPSVVRIAARPDPITGRWLAGGMIVQHMPRGEVGEERLFARDEQPHWVTARLLTETLKPDELTDPSLSVEDLLWRLFNEEEVRVQPATPIIRGCRCSVARVQEVLGQLPPDELADMPDDAGVVRVNCAFCSKDWGFILGPDGLQAI